MRIDGFSAQKLREIMPRRRKGSKPRISREYQLGQNWQLILSWLRFNQKSLNNAASRKRFRDLILDNHVSATVPGPYHQRDVVENVAARAQKPIPIDYLCAQLGEKLLPRGQVLFGSPGKYIDEIALNYPSVYWWLSDQGLRMEVLGSDGRLPSFDELAGQLVVQAREDRKGQNLRQSDYLTIAEEIDKAGFPVKEHLPKKYREKLADWNQKHPGRTIKTFVDALRAKGCELGRGIRRRFYYAEEKLRKQRP